MDENQVVWNEKVAEKLIKKLEKRRMEGSYAATAALAKEEVGGGPKNLDNVLSSESA